MLVGLISMGSFHSVDKGVFGCENMNEKERDYELA